MRRNRKHTAMAVLLAAALMAGLTACGSGNQGGQEPAGTGNTETSAQSESSQNTEENTAGGENDSVIVVMGPTSEPEAGFDPA